MATARKDQQRQHHRGYWADFKKAVEGMQLHDLLVWEVPEHDLRSTGTRRLEIHHSEFHTMAHWFDGHLFIVRVK